MVRPDSDRWVMRLRPGVQDAGHPVDLLPLRGWKPRSLQGLGGRSEPSRGTVHCQTARQRAETGRRPLRRVGAADRGHLCGAGLLPERAPRLLRPQLRGPAGLRTGPCGRDRAQWRAYRPLFVSGIRSPNSPQRRPYMHELSQDGFLDALRDMGGTPAEVLADEMLTRLFLPTTRAEIRLAELWGDRHGKGVNVPVTALYGQDDPVDGRDSMRDWKLFTEQDCELLDVAGGHFFLKTHRRSLLDVINARLGDAGGESGLQG